MTWLQNNSQMFGNTKILMHKEILHSTIIRKSDVHNVFDSEGIILQHWLPQKQAVSSVCYASALQTRFKNVNIYTYINQ
jgi:hypothetical protein